MTETEAPAERESLGTVIVAGLSNLAIAVAKAIAGLISGSAGMLSEAAHSVADTVTELLLLTALIRGDRPADDEHPFGYGKSAFFWAFLAAMATLVAGAGFAVTHGLHTIRNGEEMGDYTISYIVLAVSFVLEGISLRRAVRQVRGSARRLHLKAMAYLRLTPDTSVKAVVLEDSAALVGLGLAGLGLLLTELTGDTFYDGAASVAIGLLLAVVALTLARANVSLLVGQAPSPRWQFAIRRELESDPVIQRVLTLNAMFLGPDSVLVAAEVDVADSATGAEIEAAADAAAKRLQERYPVIRHVYLDPTATP
ncbi:MAG: cation diffusion facilitator family transporter [Hamadaea sp.]|uniref:cation diffusion facilitator family transporter n=1 Tax=Hamadaea sp. TaxID=2024425 RepID=UPI00183AEACE|nr:cation diffusion facilitator family transporter [Hamadaea sp.]NUR70725.1 cation diffusion facilitator family transporter [Hamadaea sp.]NUT21409.1 cation diffusion facilitator family transporter [Hamadaea sp.]